MAAIAIENLTKHYPGGVTAVRGIDLAVADGEMLVLIGPSGCGKTTTLRIVAGLERPSAGVVRIGGRDVTNATPRERDVAMVFQDYPLYPHLTVRRNLAFALQIRKLPRDEIARRVETAARRLRLTDRLDRKPAALSGGERQRAAVGRAMVREAACVLYDEPLASLDQTLRLHLRSELKAASRAAGATSIYVTHDQEEAMALGDRIAVMSDGRIHQVGTPTEIYDHPTNRMVAALIGAWPMNLIPGRLTQEGDTTIFTDDVDVRIRLAPARHPAVRQHAGSEAVLGIRPDALRRTGSDDAPITIEVESTEMLGDGIRVIGSTKTGTRVTSRLGRSGAPSIGERTGFAPDDDATHLFAPGESGARL